MFFAPGLISSGIEGVGSTFHVLHSLAHFWWYRGRQAQFSCFTLLGLFSAVTRALSPLFIFRALRLIFSNTEGAMPVLIFYVPGFIFSGTGGVESTFDILRSYTRRWYRGRQTHFSCSALPNSFSTILRALGPLFMFCASGLIFGGTEIIGPSFHVLGSPTYFRRY
jgi:hypothetical protein